MAKKLTTIKNLYDYFTGVVERAEHHAPHVDKIIYPLLGMIIAYKDKKAPIEVREYNGQMRNVLWAIINGTRYAFFYNHHEGTIEIHGKNARGKLEKTVTNKSTLHQLCRVFKSLMDAPPF